MIQVCSRGLKLLSVLVPLFLSGALYANDWQMNLHKGVSPLSRDMYNLHMVSMMICIVIAILVYGMLIFSMIRYRKSKGAIAAKFHHNLKVEIIWTLIPFLILVGLAIPATITLMRMDNMDDSEVTIKVIGHQWKWQYQYLNQGINFYSNLATPLSQIENKEAKSEWYLLEVDKPLVLPIHKKVRFLVTADDVIHSWWVPELGVKRDAIPGFVHEAWTRIDKEGTYRGQCAELCGIYHGYMPIVVKAVNDEEFNRWVEKQEKVSSEKKDEPDMEDDALMALGQKVYNTNCASCHKPDGTGMPPVFPALKGSSVAVGRPIARHVSLVLKGVPGTAMQAYAEQLSNKEIAAVVTYERNAWGNHTGDAVQPKFVAGVKSGKVEDPLVEKKKEIKVKSKK